MTCEHIAIVSLLAQHTPLPCSSCVTRTRPVNWWRKAWLRDTKELLFWKRHATLRDPKTGRYVKKDKRT
jgi:hypothetical protein